MIFLKFKIPKEPEKVSKSIRFDEETCNIIQKLADENDRSFNQIVNDMVKFAIDNME